MNNQDVYKTLSFSSTPKDGRWYNISPDIYIKWDNDENVWFRMMVKPGDAVSRFHDRLPDGVELFGENDEPTN
jgi:hypothetical protein